MADLSTTPFGSRLEELIESARAARDGAFNTLDAVNRQTRSACDALVREARQIVDSAAERAANRPAVEPERDARFDPEDEWELPGAPAQPTPSGTQYTDEDYPETDYPDTWLR